LIDAVGRVCCELYHILKAATGEIFRSRSASRFVKLHLRRKTHGLKNAKGGDSWSSWGGFHLELPDSKMSTSDPQAQACLDEYARLTHEEGKSKNEKFETDYEKLLKPFFEKYEKKK
jgi:hypothetical protein